MGWLSRGECVPRKAPDVVNEHRLTLGTYERQAVEPLAQAVRRASYVATAASTTIGVGLLTVAGATAFFGLQAWLNINDLKSEANELGEKVKGGVKTAVFGPDKIKANKPPPPDSSFIGDAFRDPDDPMSYRNPWAGVPVIGPLFGLGMKIGVETDPFS